MYCTTAVPFAVPDAPASIHKVLFVFTMVYQAVEEIDEPDPDDPPLPLPLELDPLLELFEANEGPTDFPLEPVFDTQLEYSLYSIWRVMGLAEMLVLVP